MAVIQSLADGNWATPGTWSGGVAPGNGDRAWITHNVTLAVSRTVGTSQVIATGTGTVTSSGTTVTGSGTLFLTECKIGDTLVIGTNLRTVVGITDDTHITTASSLTQAAPIAYSIRPYAVYVVGASSSLTIATGAVLTVRGDANLKQTTLLLQEGSGFRFDSSLASGTPVYQLHPGAGDLVTYTSTIQADGVQGNPVTIDIAPGSGVGQIINQGGRINQLRMSWVNFSDIGSSESVYLTDVQGGASKDWYFRSCTFTRCGSIRNYSASGHMLSSNFDFSDNTLISLPTALAGTKMEFVRFVFDVGVPTGTRTARRNQLSLPNADVECWFSGNDTNLIIEDNMMNRCQVATGGTGVTFTDNLLYVRHFEDALTNWSFISAGGAVLLRSYMLQDEGPAQSNERALMASDTPNVAGLWTNRQFIYDRSGTASSGYDAGHIGAPTVAGFIGLWDGCLILPSGDGFGSGAFRMRGSANSNVRFTHCTLMGDNAAGGTVTAGVVTGASYAGHAGMVDQFESNLIWQKQVYARSGSGGWSLSYSNGSPVANVLNAAQCRANAHYNVTAGTVYDAAGANPTTVTGYHGFRQATKPTNATDVLLGTGSDEAAQGPKFKAPTRNAALFDRAYLGNTSVSAWSTGQSYVVGDIVSASDSTYYGGATINYHCVKAHTSNSGDATNGKPGAATTSYRTNWEFATMKRVADAKAAGTTYSDSGLGLTNVSLNRLVHAWTFDGFAPSEPSLATAAWDGATIGAVPYQAALGGGASLSSISPSSGVQGSTVPITITGSSTNFSGSSVVTVSGTGVSVSSTLAPSSTSITCTLTISGSATAGARTLTVTTGSEVVTSTFTVTAVVPSISSLSPSSGRPGQAVPITIVGTSTNFSGSSVVTVSGSGVTVSATSAPSATAITCTLTIDAAAALGARTLTVTTGSEVVTSTFTLTSGNTLINTNWIAGMRHRRN